MTLHGPPTNEDTIPDSDGPPAGTDYPKGCVVGMCKEAGASMRTTDNESTVDRKSARRRTCGILCHLLEAEFRHEGRKAFPLPHLIDLQERLIRLP